MCRGLGRGWLKPIMSGVGQVGVGQVGLMQSRLLLSWLTVMC